MVAGKKAIDDKRWADAIKALSSAALRDTRNADIQNYLGYAYRNAGQMDKAFAHYERALKLNPRHRGAHEYVGEAYLLVDDLSKAEEHVAALRNLPYPVRGVRRSEDPGQRLPQPPAQVTAAPPAGFGPLSALLNIC